MREVLPCVGIFEILGDPRSFPGVISVGKWIWINEGLTFLHVIVKIVVVGVVAPPLRTRDRGGEPKGHHDAEDRQVDNRGDLRVKRERFDEFGTI